MKLAVFDSSTSGPLTDSMCRRYLLLAGLAMILAQPTSAQIDSALSLFPLIVGDVWHYHEFYTIPYPLEYVFKYHFVRVVGDSSMPNGKRYKHLHNVDQRRLDVHQSSKSNHGWITCRRRHNHFQYSCSICNHGSRPAGDECLDTRLGR